MTRRKQPLASTEPPAEQYARAVVAERIVASRYVILACERHLRDLRDAHKRGLHFDAAAAQYTLDFFPLVSHYRGREWAGKSFIPEPWQQFIVWSVFGWKKADGMRRFRTAHVEVAKGNGKTPLGAVIGLYMLSADGEPGAEVYCVATKKDQARILFGDALAMRDRSPSLSKHIQKFRDNLSIPSKHAKFEPLGADKDTLDGPRPHCLLLDELHAWRTRGLLDVLEEGLDKRLQPLALRITTAGAQLESVYTQEHEYAVRMLESADPAADDSLFAYIAAVDPEDDWKDERCWIKANPNLGVSVKIEDLRVRAAKAKAQPSYLNSFLRFRLNRQTRQTTAGIDMDKWNACAGFSLAGKDAKVLRLEQMKALRGRRCFAALDLSSKTDLTALVLAFEPESGEPQETEPWVLLPFFWMPKDNIAERAEEDRAPYDVWEREGFIEATPGNYIDQKFIIAECERLVNVYQFHTTEDGKPEIAMDPFNSSQALVELQERGFCVVEFRQGWKTMNEPTKSFLGMIPAKRIAHLANPVLSRMAGNLMIRTDPAGNQKPTKENPKNKIDGIVAAIMALGRGLANPGDGGSAYTADRGVFTV